MSLCLHKTNQYNHDSNDYNDPIPEVDFDDETDDEDRYLDEERMSFIKNLKPVGNSFALVRKSNGDPTHLIYEGLSDGEDCVNDSDRRITRSFTRKIQGSNSLSYNVSPSGLAKKRENDQNNGADTKRVGLNCVLPRRNKKPRVIKKVGGDGHSGKVDKVVRGLAKKKKNDQDNGANIRKVGSNCLSDHYLRPRRNHNPGVFKKVGDDGGSGKADRIVRGLAKKHSNDQDNGAVKNVKRSSIHTWRNSRGLVYGDHSGNVDKWRARRLSGLRYRRGWAKKLKNNQGNVAENESICIIQTRGGQGDGAEKANNSCLVESQGGQGNGAVKERRICNMETQRDQGNGAEKEISCKVEALHDQDYGDSNRAYGIWLRDNIAKICDLENGDVETSSDSELEVLDKDPQCSEWKYTPLADSNLLDTSMEDDDDIQYIGECSKPENPQFRKDVEDILGRPYDEKEYETLWLQVNSRKPVQGYRELRGHLKAYSKDAMGKSYLDEYLDLGRKLDTFETDQPRKLSVLRGFFYYLKNIASDGIFKPWLDESCLAIVPRTE